jgi:hypothetical protein
MKKTVKKMAKAGEVVKEEMIMITKIITILLARKIELRNQDDERQSIYHKTTIPTQYVVILDLIKSCDCECEWLTILDLITGYISAIKCNKCKQNGIPE